MSALSLQKANLEVLGVAAGRRLSGGMPQAERGQVRSERQQLASLRRRKLEAGARSDLECWGENAAAGCDGGLNCDDLPVSENRQVDC